MDKSKDKVKLESRATVLSTCQNWCLVATLVIIIATVLVLTSFSVDMFIYNEGNVYSCPKELIISNLIDEHEDTHGRDSGRHYQLDPISHREFEDMVYDPMMCRPFYQDEEAPIWYGRVEEMNPLH